LSFVLGEVQEWADDYYPINEELSDKDLTSLPEKLMVRFMNCLTVSLRTSSSVRQLVMEKPQRL